MSTRRITFFAGIVGVAFCAGAQASVSLGELEPQSQLGQPLNLLISLGKATPGELEGAMVRIAEKAIYQRSAAEPQHPLDQATVRIIQRDGQPYVQVRTPRPLREPILQMLVEVNRPDGAVFRRDYGLLLDPPGYASGLALATTPQEVFEQKITLPQHPMALPTTTDVGDVTESSTSLLAARSSSAAPEVSSALTVRTRATPQRQALNATKARFDSPTLRTSLWSALALILTLTLLWLRRGRASPPEPEVYAANSMDPPLPSPPRAAAPPRAMPSPALIAAAQTQRSQNQQRLAAASVTAAASTTDEPVQTLDFYREVAQLLRAELDSDPARTDLRHKLIEVYYASGAKEDFREQVRYYLEQLQGRADAHWAGIVAMGRDLLPDSSLFTDTPQVMARTVVQSIQLMPIKPPTFQRFYEAVNPAKLSARQAELERAWDAQSGDPTFHKAFAALLGRCMQRPTLLIQAAALGASFGGARIYRKYEDQHGDSDIPMINALGQVLLARRMGKKRVVAASVRGVHGVAVASAARALELECVIYMMEGDQRKQQVSVDKIGELGAQVMTVFPSMVATSDDVRIRALDDWMQDGDTTLYINSVDAGPYPYPSMVLNFQMLVGREARAQMLDLTGKLPDAVVTSTADGLSAIGLLQSFFASKSVALYCVQSATITPNSDARHSFRREHSWMRASGRVDYVEVPVDATKQALADAARSEDWVLEAAAGEVLAQAQRLAKELGPEKSVLVILPKPQPLVVQTMPLRAAG